MSDRRDAAPTGIPTGVADIHVILVGTGTGEGDSSTDPDCGLPIAVVPQSGLIPAPARQSLAARIGTPFTVFLDRAQGDILDVAPYTPTRHEHRCGATAIAAAWYQCALQRTGIRTMRCRTRAGMVQVNPVPDGALVIRTPFATPTVVESAQGPSRATTVTADAENLLMIAVADREALEVFDANKSLQEMAAPHGASILVAHTTPESGPGGRDAPGLVTARSFKLGGNSAEIAMSFSAASTLAGRLASDTSAPSGQDRFDIVQPAVDGVQPRCLRAEIRRQAEDGTLMAVDIGGCCRHFGSTTFSW